MGSARQLRCSLVTSRAFLYRAMLRKVGLVQHSSQVQPQIPNSPPTVVLKFEMLQCDSNPSNLSQSCSSSRGRFRYCFHCSISYTMCSAAPILIPGQSASSGLDVCKSIPSLCNYLSSLDKLLDTLPFVLDPLLVTPAKHNTRW